MIECEDLPLFYWVLVLDCFLLLVLVVHIFHILEHLIH